MRAFVKKKSFVLDTNVLLYDPHAFLKFPDREVVLAFSVLEELGTMKRYRDELGKNARVALRLLDHIRLKESGDLHSGVSLENGSVVRIEVEPYAKNGSTSELLIREHKFSNKTILLAKSLQVSGQAVCFVSKDFVARLKAEAVGLEAEDYENFKEAFDAVCYPIQEMQVPKRIIDSVYKDGKVKIETKEPLTPHEFLKLKSEGNSELLVKHYLKDNFVGPLHHFKKPVWGITPLNDEQRCAMELLLDEDIKLVVLVGQAGTGKTLLAVACGLAKVFNENVYSKILISRPIMPLGKDIGYLPGSKEEKLQSWMQPIYDNLEFLCETQGEEESSETLRWILESQKIEMEAVTYIRGRTLPKSYVIIDEAQNLTGHEIKTIISRAGKNTKVILTGDPTQIDNPYLDKDTNGITLTIAKFRAHPIFGHVYLSTTERSQLAALAADLM